MEDIYLNGHGRREWCSDKTNLGSYFQRYKQLLSSLTNGAVSKCQSSFEWEIIQHVTKSNQLTHEELLKLTGDLHGSNLTTFTKEDMVVSFDRENAGGKYVSLKKQTKEKKEEYALPVNKSISKTTKKNAFRSKISLNLPNSSGIQDLHPHTHFIVKFCIHEPFLHIVGENSPPGRCTQEIAVLGHQPLTALRDRIICERDFQDLRGDISDSPNTPPKSRARDKFLSSMFYFDNTFYVDKRHNDYMDYSEPIRSWAAQRGMKVGGSLAMSSVSVDKLNVRFGYPYVYIHQGDCEHLVIISDARLINQKDNRCSMDYPVVTKISQHKKINCEFCNQHPAKWIVEDCDRVVHSPSYECQGCFKTYHYKNGMKVGKFKAFLFTQRSAIL